MADAAAPLPTVTDLAVSRTCLAHERTLMAWVRTAISLISFGFAIYKFFDFMRSGGAAGTSQGFFNARRYAIFVISTGLIALLLATWEHQKNMRALRAMFPQVPYSGVTVFAGLISLLGIVTLIAVILRQ
jgi:inner membrane protein YidH